MSSVLRTAAALIEQQGWNRGEFCTDTGALDVRGAMHVATGRPAINCGLEEDGWCVCVGLCVLLAKHTNLHYQVNDDGAPIPDSVIRAVDAWNDHTASPAEVVATLRKVSDATHSWLP